jgi:hypothetical protein
MFSSSLQPSPSRGGLGGDGVGSGFELVAKTGSRPCVVCRPSMAASYFLLLAQKKVTKENGTLGSAPSPTARVRYGRTGFAHRPSMARCPNRRDPSRRPRAGHAAGPSTLRRYSEGTRRAKRKKRKKPTCRIYPVSHISGASAAGTAALCSSGFPLGRGEQAQEIAARSAGARRMRARPISAQGCAVSGPRSLLAEFAGRDAGKPRTRGCLFLWLLSFGQAKESNWRPWMADITHTDVSRLSRQHRT